jgi:hypothetical protein
MGSLCLTNCRRRKPIPVTDRSDHKHSSTLFIARRNESNLPNSIGTFLLIALTLQTRAQPSPARACFGLFCFVGGHVLLHVAAAHPSIQLPPNRAAHPHISQRVTFSIFLPLHLLSGLHQTQEYSTSSALLPYYAQG